MKRRFKDQQAAAADGTRTLPQAILTLTESPDNPSGFTIGLALASHSNADDVETFRIPAVDIVVLALVNILKKTPTAFTDEMNAINSALIELSKTLGEDGADSDAAIAQFNNAVGVPAYVRPGA